MKENNEIIVSDFNSAIEYMEKSIENNSHVKLGIILNIIVNIIKNIKNTNVDKFDKIITEDDLENNDKKNDANEFKYETCLSLEEISILEKINILEKCIYSTGIQWINNVNVRGFCEKLKEDIDEIIKNIDIGTAIETLVKELKKDKGLGSYYHGWQSNLAMKILDNCDNKLSAEKCNDIAVKFLDYLIEQGESVCDCKCI
jgi:hypothetical protein